MRRIFYILIFISFSGLGQTDSLDFFDRKFIADGVYVPEPDPLSNACFLEESFSSLWQIVQYKKWEEIQNEQIDVSTGYSCPEIAVELYGKELDFLLEKHYMNVSTIESAFNLKRADTIMIRLYPLIRNQNPIVRAKSLFLLGHQLIHYKKDAIKHKVKFLSLYIDLLNQQPKILESGQNYGPNLLDYRSTLWDLIPSIAKYGDPDKGEQLIYYLAQTFVHSEFDAKTKINFAHYYAIIGNQKKSWFYIHQVQPEISKEFYAGLYDGYFQTQLINLMNTHFNSKKFMQKIGEFETKEIGPEQDKKFKNKLKIRNKRKVILAYKYDTKDDPIYKLIKYQNKKYQAVFEATGYEYPATFIIYEKGKLKCIQYRAPLISKVNPPNQFTVWFDKDGLVESISLSDGNRHALRADFKGKSVSYLLNKKKVKDKKIGFQILKNYLIQQGFKNWFKYNIPGGYEDLNGL
ncbi:MAG: hypothetical protein R2799_02990 [Crocinitomicaceae bacterium]